MVIRQLWKISDIEIVTIDPRDETSALEDAIIEKEDIQQETSPVPLEQIVKAAKPDLALRTMSTEDWVLGEAPEVNILAESLKG